MNEQRRADIISSPKSSPRGSRSPAYPRQDSSSGLLKVNISLGRNPTIFHSGNFYLMNDPPENSDLTGNTNLMSTYGLAGSYNKFNGKKLKQELSAFIPNLPGNIDSPGHIDHSSLRSLIDKPPITNKELLPISSTALSGFRLHPGPLPERFRLMNQTPQRNKKMKKKHKRDANREGGLGHDSQDSGLDGLHDHKKKKSKRTEEEKEKRKKKKERKRKKEREKEEKGPQS